MNGPNNVVVIHFDLLDQKAKMEIRNFQMYMCISAVISFLAISEAERSDIYAVCNENGDAPSCSHPEAICR